MGAGDSGRILLPPSATAGKETFSPRTSKLSTLQTVIPTSTHIREQQRHNHQRPSPAKCIAPLPLPMQKPRSSTHRPSSLLEGRAGGLKRVPLPSSFTVGPRRRPAAPGLRPTSGPANSWSPAVELGAPSASCRLGSRLHPRRPPGSLLTLWVLNSPAQPRDPESGS